MQKLLVYFKIEDGKINEIDTRSLWSYEQAKKTEINTNVLTSFKDHSDLHAQKTLEEFEQVTKNRIDKVKKSSGEITTRYFSKKAQIL